MAFAEHVDKLNAAERDPRGPERFEAEHRAGTPLDVAMVLLDDVVEVLASPNLDVRSVVGVVASLDACLVGAALVDVDERRQAVLADGLLQEAACSIAISASGQEEVDGVAARVHGAVQVTVLAVHLHVGFVHSPAAAHRRLALLERGQQLRRAAVHPAENRRVVDVYPALLEVPVAQAVPQVPPHALQNDVFRMAVAFELHTAGLPRAGRAPHERNTAACGAP